MRDNKILMKYIKFTPIFLWLLYFSINLNSSLSSVDSRLEVIALSRTYSVGGFPFIYNMAAYSSFLDELLLLIIALLVYKFLKRRFS